MLRRWIVISEDVLIGSVVGENIIVTAIVVIIVISENIITRVTAGVIVVKQIIIARRIAVIEYISGIVIIKQITGTIIRGQGYIFILLPVSIFHKLFI